MIKIETHGFRIYGDWKNLTLVTLRRAAKATKAHEEGELLEADPRYYPDMESACAALAKRYAVGGDAETITSLAGYVARLEDAVSAVRALVSTDAQVTPQGKP